MSKLRQTDSEMQTRREFRSAINNADNFLGPRGVWCRSRFYFEGPAISYITKVMLPIWFLPVENVLENRYISAFALCGNVF